MSRKLSEEHKQKMLAGKKAKKSIVKANPFARHTIYLTGKEENGFDFFPAVRKALRSHFNYISGPKIEKELANKKQWKNKEYCMAVIEKHFDVSYLIQPEKKKKASRYQKYIDFFLNYAYTLIKENENVPIYT